MRRWLCFALLFFLCGAVFCLPASAAMEEELFADFFAALPEDVREQLADKTDVGEAGALVGAEYLMSVLLSSLEGGLAASGGFFLRLMGVAILLSVLSHFARDLGSETATRAAEMGIAVVLTFLVYQFAATDISRVGECLSDMRAFADGLIPVFFGLYAAGGSTATATAAAAGFTSLSYLLQHFCAALLLPLLQLLFGFTAIHAAGGKMKTEGVFSSLRGLYVTSLGFLSLLLVTSLGFQSALAASADSLAAQSVRFAVGNLIPVVGGSLSGTLRTLGASLTLLKGTVGTLSVAALLLLLLPALVSLLLHRFFLSLAASVCGMLGSERAGKIFTAFRGIYDLAAATLALCLVVFLLILALLVRLGVASAPA